MAPKDINETHDPSSSSSNSGGRTKTTASATTLTMDGFNSTSTIMSSPRPTLREEAAIRAEQETPTPRHESFPFHQASPYTPQPHQQQQQQHYAFHHPLAFGSDNNNNNNNNTTPGTATTTTSPETLVQSARKEWRSHGTGITQSLEEKRRLDEERAGTITVRVLSAETRHDVSGSKYMAYILRVQLANGQVLQIEHRYSEFAKLNAAFKSHHVVLNMDAAFPSKHWAGRMGNWTPSLKWAPEKHDELVLYRKIQLDVWLVHVVEKYNLGDLPHSLAKAVYDFLTLPDRPPCEQENAVSAEKQDWAKWNNPLSFTLGSTIRQATSTLEHMVCGHDKQTLFGESDQSIPLDLLQCAKGLCFLTVIKAGLVVSGRIGTGLLIAKQNTTKNKTNDDDNNNDRWSAPCALGTVGMGWGMLAGGDITHYLVVLTTHEAVESLLAGTVQLGAELGVAVGPTGRSANSHVAASNHSWTVHPAYSYAHSQGLFVGMSLEGSILTTRSDVNAKFYGRTNLSPTEIISEVAPPKAAEPLYHALARAMKTTIPEGSFRPSQLFQDNNNNNNNDTVRGSSSSKENSDWQPTVDALGRVTVSEPMSPAASWEM